MAKQELEMSINDLRERMIIAEDTINFCRNKYDSILGDEVEYFDLDTQILYNKSFESPEAMKLLVRVLFSSLKNMLFENYQMIGQR